jgi:DNA ligase (NAD+)
MSRLNEQIIDMLEKLSNIMIKQGEPFRSRAYQKAQETIISCSTDITSSNLNVVLKGLPNIGPTIMEKLNEFISKGTLDIIERDKNNPINMFCDVYGIGPKKAKELVDVGITTIQQLRNNANTILNDTQKVGLNYYEDILKRIPRSEIDSYNTIFATVFHQNPNIFNNSKYEIVGSYRRGAENSGDIDVIITSTNSNIFVNFVDFLIKQKIIIEVLSRGTSKCLVITKINANACARRVDFLFTSPEEYPFAVLYFTGSKIFNTVMRRHALNMGLTMNEHGICFVETKNKVAETFNNERDIFKYLSMEYKEPWERIDGRSVIPSGKNKIQDFIHHFKKNGASILNTLTQTQLEIIVKELNNAYYNSSSLSLVTDNEYDIIKHFIEVKYPTSSVVSEVGAPVVTEKNKCVLPYFMGSMDKIKPDSGSIVSWCKKFNGPTYVISCKLDGVSGLYTTEGPVPKLYTRGDGKVGQDISYLIQHMNLPKTKNIVLRGEFIIPKKVFETKYKANFANPRNMVAGIINHKTVDKNKIADVHFVAYEVIKPVMKPSDQMAFLSTNLNIECALNAQVNSISNDSLSSYLIEFRKSYLYEIDGIIVTDNKIYERPTSLCNPSYAFAFKMVLSEQIAEATVIDVIWTPSKDGYLKPRVQILPINLGGVQIEYATGFNGAFIKDNKIGIGAIIKIIRSGDVIPHILSVTSPANVTKMPDVPYKWNNTNVDIVIENIGSDETVREKNITGFFKGIQVDGLGSGNVSRIIECGFNTIPKIINMTINDFLKIEGFATIMASKIHAGIKQQLTSVSLITLMSASNLFGRGFSEKKMELIMESYSDILVSNESPSQKIRKMVLIKGIAEKSAEMFVEKIPDFLFFIKECKLEHKITEFVTSKIVTTKKGVLHSEHVLFEKTIIMTGFRDKVIEEALKKFGAKIGTSVSKNTFIVLVKNKNDDTTKILDAKKLGIPIMDVHDFTSTYKINN